MKTIFKFFIFIVALCYNIDSHGQFNYSFKAGMSLSKIKADPVSGKNWVAFYSKYKMGYQVGIDISYGLNNSFEVNTGLSFIRKGNAIDLERTIKELDPTPEVKGHNITILNYFEIPLQLVYKIHNIEFFSGPYVLVLVNGKNNYDYTLKEDWIRERNYKGEIPISPTFGSVAISDNKTYYKAIDYGASFGIGYQIRLFKLRAVYALGLQDMQPKTDSSGVWDIPENFEGPIVIIPKIKHTNRSINLTLSYLLSK